ncbi:hypothetical protein CCYA_CCYA07G2066 [Cyanidiococcus yangmingshanensis]|nr:hypothetical protein CCYA_CCYA07G2066 [Cyanidiococcus yangmingshanensis]
MEPYANADALAHSDSKKKKKKKSGAPALPDLGESNFDGTVGTSPTPQVAGEREAAFPKSGTGKHAGRQDVYVSEISAPAQNRIQEERFREPNEPGLSSEGLPYERTQRKQSVFAAFSALALSDDDVSETEETPRVSAKARQDHQGSNAVCLSEPINGSETVTNTSNEEAAAKSANGSEEVVRAPAESRRTGLGRLKKSEPDATDAWTPSDAFSDTSKKIMTVKKTKNHRANEDDPEIEAILAELDALEDDSSSKSKASKKQKRKAKKASQQGSEDDETFNQILAEYARETDISSSALQRAEEKNWKDIQSDPSEATILERGRHTPTDGPEAELDSTTEGVKVQMPQASFGQKHLGEIESSDEVSRFEPEAEPTDAATETQGRQLSAAQKKRLKKKQKEASKKAEAAPEGDEAAGSVPIGANKAIVRRILAEQQRRAEEEERRRREEEARLALELERQRQEEEEVRQREEARRLKKEAERARREQLRREGKLLSKAERQRRQRVEAFIQQNMASGTIAAASLPQEATKLQRRIYDDRKKKSRLKTSLPSSSEDAMHLSDRPEDEALVSNADKPSAIADSASLDARDQVSSSVLDELSESSSSEEERALSLDSEGTAEEVPVHRKGRPSVALRHHSTNVALSADERRQLAVRQRLADEASARAAATADRLRSPIICILGHVDTGKTKLLDKIRHTHVQEGEAGGITQQIGATYFPIEAVRQEASKVNAELRYRIPSLLIIDTPGHESFTNLRSRGSSLCDIAILVVDIMHGLEQQTLESIELLKMRKTPFIVALNKVDRLYGWTPCAMSPIRYALEQNAQTQAEFEKRVAETKTAFAEIGFNAELYWENTDFRRNLSLVPTSAISGEGIPDLLMLLVQLPQRLLVDRLMFVDFPYCTVLEVKVIDGLGTTIDVVLTGGALHEGDTIVVCGLDGPIVTTVRALLTPHPMKEMRVKGQYIHHRRIEAAQGVKISAEGLEKAVAGTQMLVARNPDEIEYLKEEVMTDLSTTLAAVDTSGIGVYVQASTLGSLEALLEFLRKDAKIPISGVNIGPVHKRDVVRASTMLEHLPEYAVILAFDVKVEREAREEAENLGVQIFTADIIYHLFDHFRKYMEQVKERKKRDAEADVVFPVCATILPDSIFNKRDPLIFGVHIDEGVLRCGSSLVAVHEDLGRMVDIGRVLSIESNKKSVTQARRGDNVAIKVSSRQTSHVMYGRQFDHTFKLYSRITRRAIDLLKELYRDELTKEDWQLVLKLKKMFGVL